MLNNKILKVPGFNIAISSYARYLILHQKVIRHLYLLNNPVSLKNGAILLTDGIINMTNGSTPSLKEDDYIDMDGNIRPLPKLIVN